MQVTQVSYIFDKFAISINCSSISVRVSFVGMKTQEVNLNCGTYHPDFVSVPCRICSLGGSQALGKALRYEFCSCDCVRYRWDFSALVISVCE